MDCRVTLAQTNPALGDVAKNLEQHVEQVEAARAEGADLVLFPELSLTGYFLRDQTPEVALRADAAPLARLAELSRGPSIVAGWVERSPEGRLYNALGFFEDGALRHVHRKVHLVTYGMFDDEREFAAGDVFTPVESRLGRFGLLLCEDFWHVSSAYQYFLADVDALLVASCAPGRGIAGGAQELTSERTWRALLVAQALCSQTWVLWANRVGWEDGILFSGGSTAVDPFGTEVANLEGFDPGAVSVRITSAALDRARATTPLRRDEKPWILERFLRRREEDASA